MDRPVLFSTSARNSATHDMSLAADTAGISRCESPAAVAVQSVFGRYPIHAGDGRYIPGGVQPRHAWLR